MRHRITRLFGPVVFLVLALSLAMPINSALGQGTAAFNPQSDAPQTGPQVDQQYALVQLKGDPLTTSAKTRPAPGKKVDFNNSAVRAYRAQLAALRNDFKSWLRANAPKAKVTGEFDLALNAVAVKLNGERLATVAGRPRRSTPSTRVSTIPPTPIRTSRSFRLSRPGSGWAWGRMPAAGSRSRLSTRASTLRIPASTTPVM